MIIVRCPLCGEIMARDDGDGLAINHRGRKWRFAPGSQLTECYCRTCKAWFSLSEGARNGTYKPANPTNPTR